MRCPLCEQTHAAEKPCATEPEGSRVGQLIGEKYRVLRRIGAGSTSTVYETSHVTIGRSFALKFLRPDLCVHPQSLARFRAQASAAGALEHDHIAAVVDFGVSLDGAPYIAMEFLRGDDLATELAKGGALPPRRAVEIARQACAALEVAHHAGVVHRDLKPANVFLCRRESAGPWVKLLDFGTASVSGATTDGGGDGREVVGTPGYMAPEQVAGERQLDARTDVYGLGVVLFEMLSGERPNAEDSPEPNTRRSLALLCPFLAPGLIAVVERAIATKREERYANVTEFARALAPYGRTAEGAPSADADGVAEAEIPMHSTGAGWLLGLAAAILGGLAFWWLGQPAHTASDDSTPELENADVHAVLPLPSPPNVAAVPTSSLQSNTAPPSAQSIAAPSSTAVATSTVTPPAAAKRAAAANPPATATAAATAKPAPDCRQNWRVDRDGIRRLKPECLPKAGG